MTGLYDFPSNLAAGQTIAIFSEAGYLTSDIAANFSGTPPNVTDISINASNNGDPTSDNGETTQDIVISASVAPGADVAVYFCDGSQKGWVDLVGRVVHPDLGDPVCSVLSSSFYILNGDDQALSSGVTAALVNAVSQAFADAAVQRVTVCIASGDQGTKSKIADGAAHVQYPGSDPWALSCGGTTIGDVTAAGFAEWAWNDSSGASGGGVSAVFPRPAYQVDAGVPASLNDGHVGRGVPDVAANSSGNSGYPLTVTGFSSYIGGGTSASAPLWAGLIARLNAALGEDVGFVNPVLYALGSSVFRDIVAHPGDADNGLGGTAGYPVTTGWDACTGWGSPSGRALLTGLRHFFGPVVAVSLQDDLQFGTVCRGPEYRTLTVSNVGTTDLMVLDVARVSGSPAFSVLPLPSTPLALKPGAEIAFTVEYQPAGPGTTQSATIRVTTDDALEPELDLITSATPASGSLRTVIADSGDFGACCLGSFVDRPLTLVNDGPCKLTIDGLVSSDADVRRARRGHLPADRGRRQLAGDADSLPSDRARPERRADHDQQRRSGWRQARAGQWIRSGRQAGRVGLRAVRRGAVLRARREDDLGREHGRLPAAGVERGVQAPVEAVGAGQQPVPGLTGARRAAAGRAALPRD